MENQVYMLERKERKIYHDPDLQMSFILLIFSLMLRPKYEFFLFYYFPSKVNHCLFVARPWNLSIAINFLLTTRSLTSPSTLIYVPFTFFLIISFFMILILSFLRYQSSGQCTYHPSALRTNPRDGCQRVQVVEAVVPQTLRRLELSHDGSRWIRRLWGRL